LKILDEEVRVRKITQKRAKMKKRSRYHRITMQSITPQCKEINLKQIYKILEENLVTSYHNGSLGHRAMMVNNRAIFI
jgi:hypothetical protein